ncbi:MAG: hypothetical protein E7086_09355 [Bacteroidales bacterium]|nr:hypothetical protein [Bacteroidales bacterium]
MKKQNNISFVPSWSEQFIKDAVKKYSLKLSSIKKILAEKGEDTLEKAIKYQSKGADFERKAVLAECEEYIKNTGMPTYLQEDARKRAYNSCDNDFIGRLSVALRGCSLRFDKDVIEVSGEWTIAEHIREEIVAQHTYTFTDEEQKAYSIYRELCEKAKELHAMHYYLNDTGGDSDFLCPPADITADYEQFLSYRIMTPAERQERLRKIGY